MGIKVNAIISSTIGWLITFCIYPFVMGIIILSNSNKFENKGHAIATGIILIFFLFTAGFTFLILPIVFSCLLKVKTKEEDDDY